MEFEAVVAIDPRPGGKKLQAVWLVRDDGERWVIDYRPRGLWRPFEDERVQVTGARYEPEGQAIGAQHFRVDTMRTIDPESTSSLIALGPEQHLCGRLEIREGDPGSKMGGEGYPVFVAESGATYQLANHIEAEPGPLTIRAREATRSRFVAHAPGPLLWVL